MSVNKYIDIDSSFRDIFAYPNAGNFVTRINTTLPPGGRTAFNAVVPVSLSFPYDTGILQATATVTPFFIYTTTYYFLTMQLSATAREQVNFYVGSYINFPYALPTVVPGQLYGTPNLVYWYIVGYLSATRTVYCIPNNLIVPTTDVYSLTYTPFYVPTVLPNYGPGYFIRYELPLSFAPGVYDDVITASTSTTVITPGPLSSNFPGSYVGYFLFVPPAVIPVYPFYVGVNPEWYIYQFPVIKSYTITPITLVHVMTLSSALVTTYPLVGLPAPTPLSTPINGVYNICPFSYDQCRSLQYAGTEIFNNPRCCDITLTNLTLPANIPLNNEYGGAITDYPFLWVELSSEIGRTYQQVIMSASVASKNALFKCSVAGNANPLVGPSFGYPVSPYPFLNLSPLMGNQSVNFRLNDDLRFRILMPDGSPLSFNNKYFNFVTSAFAYFPGLNFPVPPDPREQVQATFNIQFSNK